MGKQFKILVNGVKLTSSVEGCYDLDFEKFKDMNTRDLPLDVQFELESIESIDWELDYLTPNTIINHGELLEITVRMDLYSTRSMPALDEERFIPEFCEYDYKLLLKHSRLKDLLLRVTDLHKKIENGMAELYFDEFIDTCNVLISSTDPTRINEILNFNRVDAADDFKDEGKTPESE